MAKKIKWEKIDGLGPKEIHGLIKVIRQRWSWSTARKICCDRATDKEGFGHCELCKAKVPKVYADHKKRCGQWDNGYIDRMFCPSSGLQALCKKCHAKKTRQEKKDDTERIALQKGKPLAKSKPHENFKKEKISKAHQKEINSW